MSHWRTPPTHRFGLITALMILRRRAASVLSGPPTSRTQPQSSRSISGAHVSGRCRSLACLPTPVRTRLDRESFQAKVHVLVTRVDALKGDLDIWSAGPGGGGASA